MIHEWLGAALLVTGSVLILIASIGLFRMPDLYMRMQAATKASSFGAGATLLGAAVHFADLDMLARAMATVAFIFLTFPLAAHLVARAAHRAGVPTWSGMKVDELHEDRPRVR